MSEDNCTPDREGERLAFARLKQTRIGTVTQPATRQDGDQQGQGPAADEESQVGVGHDRDGEQRRHDPKGVDADVEQNGQKKASPLVVEHPCHGDGEAASSDVAYTTVTVLPFGTDNTTAKTAMVLPN